MKYVFFPVFFILFSIISFGQQKTIHVYVALCDNEFQGIVPVPDQFGNGKDPKGNLYWGALYGIKSYFNLKAKDWVLVKDFDSSEAPVLDRVLFRHATKDIYLLADAYDGEEIKTCTERFLESSNSQNPESISIDSKMLQFGGNSDLIAYVGHNGLMDFDVNIAFKRRVTKQKDVMILACYSRHFFSNQIMAADANPILWTTHLMAPEAYSLKSAIDGWMENETGGQIQERAAQAYNKFQKCGIKGARNLFTTGFRN